MSLEQIAKEIKQELVKESSMAVGKVLRHPDGRTVKIKSGCFLDPAYARVSNFWTWNEVLSDGSLGPTESGYGW